MTVSYKSKNRVSESYPLYNGAILYLLLAKETAEADRPPQTAGRASQSEGFPLAQPSGHMGVSVFPSVFFFSRFSNIVNVSEYMYLCETCECMESEKNNEKKDKISYCGLKKAKMLFFLLFFYCYFFPLKIDPSLCQMT